MAHQRLHSVPTYSIVACSIGNQEGTAKADDSERCGTDCLVADDSERYGDRLNSKAVDRGP